MNYSSDQIIKQKGKKTPCRVGQIEKRQLHINKYGLIESSG